MHLRWTPAAAADLKQISDYLKSNHPNYRQPAMRKLYDGVRSLKDRPHIGREEGTNELLVPPLPYVVVYAVKGQVVEVPRVYHGAQYR